MKSLPKSSIGDILVHVDKKLERKRQAEEEGIKREAILNGLLIDVADAFQLDFEIVKAGVSQELVVLVRRIFYFIARQQTEYSYKSMVNVAGKKDHASCIYHIKKVRKYFKDKDPDFIALWNHYLKGSKLFTKKDFQ